MTLPYLRYVPMGLVGNGGYRNWRMTVVHNFSFHMVLNLNNILPFLHVYCQSILGSYINTYSNDGLCFLCNYIQECDNLQGWNKVWCRRDYVSVAELSHKKESSWGWASCCLLLKHNGYFTNSHFPSLVLSPSFFPSPFSLLLHSVRSSACLLFVFRYENIDHNIASLCWCSTLVIRFYFSHNYILPHFQETNKHVWHKIMTSSRV